MKIRKKQNLACLLLAGILLLFTACGAAGDGSASATSLYTPAEMAQAILAAQANPPVLYSLASGSNGFSSQLENAYQLDPAAVTDGVIAYSMAFEATEVAILIMEDEQAAAAGAHALREYIAARVNTFTGYAPEQAALAEKGVVVQRGPYLALLILAADDGAQASFNACFGDEPPPLGDTALLVPESAPPLYPDSSGPSSSDASTSLPASQPAASTAPPSEGYDPKAILAAWQSGDDSALAEKNRTILQRCREVIEQEIAEGMSAYEKELAIHDWIVQWAEYDIATTSQNPRAVIEPDNDNPYGLLVGQKAICRGYSSTFQLFMDMLEIECITVEGAANEDYEEHAWNLVRLDGDWYCVDVTWDDPYGMTSYNPAVQHQFFNVTSQFLRNTSHHWDENSVPECTATKYSWKG